MWLGQMAMESSYIYKFSIITVPVLQIGKTVYTLKIIIITN